MSVNAPIGVFDSGIGGVSVLHAIRSLLPYEDLIYVGDSMHLPYGEKSLERIRQYSEGVLHYFVEKGCKVVVIACNTASAAALNTLRLQYPQLPIVGMEPAVKPAAEHTQTGVVGVIATKVTFQGELFASVVERFAIDVQVMQQPCPGLVQQIEAGELNTPKTEQMLRGWLQPMLDAGIDELVLGCTHYPFVMPLLQRIVGADVEVIDPAPAVARQVERVLEQHQMYSSSSRLGSLHYYTTGNREVFGKTLLRLTGERAEVQMLNWDQQEQRLSTAAVSSFRDAGR
jgi:glutamate racemase